MATVRMKDHYDQRAKDRAYEAGDLVWLYFPRRSVGRCPKLQCNWEGPYTILQRLTEVIYRLRKGQNGKIRVVHTDRLAPYTEPPTL